MDLSLGLALLSGVAIAAACGLRAFLPLFALGLAGRLGWVTLQPAVDWLAGDHALWALGVAMALEIAADKIPVVDHVLDLFGTVLRPAAAWLGAYAVLGAWPTPWAQLAALALGATALAVHGLKAKLRLGSTAVTLGQANPVVSIAEDVLAFLALLAAIVLPILALAIPLLLLWAFTRRSRRAVSPASGSPLSPGGSA
ncbi:MAG TPA: DUF4126 domain-containing protein [Candidatus Limnocylindria bacterium]|nr:DUF4126 domain-containing protein [Candidatus Limnocylindria bacterium]